MDNNGNSEDKQPHMIPHDDTAKVSPWIKTKFSNLVRSRTSGVYFARAKVRGRLVRQSLKTKSVEVAKMRLDALLESERKRLVKRPEGSLTFADVSVEFLAEVDSNPDLKPTTKLARRNDLIMIRRYWPQLDGLKINQIKERQCKEWSIATRERYSASAFNSQLGTMRAIFECGVKMGALAENPTTGISRATIIIKPVVMPSTKEFKAILAKLDAKTNRKRAAVVVRVLAYSGLRIGAARKLMPENVNLERGYMEKPPIKYTKTLIRLPLFKELRAVLTDLLKEHPGNGQPLLPIKNPLKALKSACRDAGITPLTNHQLRHVFATRCLESGIDVRTVAEWLDHKDGGAMLLRIYAHLTEDHSQKMAKKVKF